MEISSPPKYKSLTTCGCAASEYNTNFNLDNTSIINTNNTSTNSYLYVKNNDTISIKKEETNMNMFNFDFGPCSSANVRLSPFGVAVKNDKTWVSYDSQKQQIVDVDIFNFDSQNLIYKMPVAIKDVAVGDVIIHNHFPMFVKSVDDGDIIAIDIAHGEKKTILPTTNMFGFNFVTKVVTLLPSLGSETASEDAPFGNILPFLMMSNSENNKINPLLMMAATGQCDFVSNPMMLMALAQNNSADMLPLIMMMQNQTKCKCKCGKSEN